MKNIIIYLFKKQAAKAAYKVLSPQYQHQEIQEIIDNYWQRYLKLKPDVPPMPTLGGGVMLQLAAMSKAFFEEMMHKGKEEEEATQLFYEIAWIVYMKMGKFSWWLAGIGNRKGYDKLLKATQLFRAFPFNSPSFEWEEVRTDDKTVCFDCTKCPVAEYFQQSNMSNFCTKTWCALDYPLAEVWGSKLERTGSIAGGAEKCDFKWTPKEENNELKLKNNFL